MGNDSCHGILVVSSRLGSWQRIADADVMTWGAGYPFIIVIIILKGFSAFTA